MHGNMNIQSLTLRRLRQRQRHVTPSVSDDQILFMVNTIWSPCVCRQVCSSLQPFIHFLSSFYITKNDLVKSSGYYTSATLNSENTAFGPCSL